MNVSFCSANSYMSFAQSYSACYSKNPSGDAYKSPQGGYGQNTVCTFYTSTADEKEDEKSRQSLELRELLRALKQSMKKDKNPYEASLGSSDNSFSGLIGNEDKDEDEKIQKSLNYNFKEVASKIQRAKTSMSAGQALSSARRKVLEVKRKISSGDGDPEELQLALTHARRMEMVARKKKHHLEIEEMVSLSGKREESLDSRKDTFKDLKNAMFSAGEEKITEGEDDIFEARSDMAGELFENKENLSEEMLSELNTMLSEFGEEMLKELEDVMEMLEGMEIIDPNMDSEELEQLKQKHRASEDKAIVKADMDYLKGMAEYQFSDNTGGM